MKECSIGDGVGNEGAGMEVPPNSKREGSSTSIRGGGTLGGEEEGDAASLFHFHFHFRSRKVKVRVLSQ